MWPAGRVMPTLDLDNQEKALFQILKLSMLQRKDWWTIRFLLLEGYFLIIYNDLHNKSLPNIRNIRFFQTFVIMLTPVYTPDIVGNVRSSKF